MTNLLETPSHATRRRWQTSSKEGNKKSTSLSTDALV
jgi:hypothetical protein